MKKIWVYILGILTGIAATILILIIIGKSANDDGTVFFDKPGKVMEDTSYKVIQALNDGFALANGQGDYGESYVGLTVLIYNEDGTPFYDGQIITAPKGKCFRQIGIYRYQTRIEIDKTVPIVTLYDK